MEHGGDRLLEALEHDLTVCLRGELERAGIEYEGLWVSVSGRLEAPAAAAGEEKGDPSFATVEARVTVATGENESRVREVWRKTVVRSPVLNTLAKAVDLTARLLVETGTG